MADNNCTNPPHFPPHCGCPAGYTDDSHWPGKGDVKKTGDGRDGK